MAISLPATYAVNEWRIRLEHGKKGPDDVQIWVAGPEGDFVLLSLAAIGAIVRLWHDNEDRLYPPPRFKGGRMVLDFLDECCETNLRTACERFRLQEPEIEVLPN